jgi:hypothetical protein
VLTAEISVLVVADEAVARARVRIVPMDVSFRTQVGVAHIFRRTTEIFVSVCAVLVATRDIVCVVPVAQAVGALEGRTHVRFGAALLVIPRVFELARLINT